MRGEMERQLDQASFTSIVLIRRPSSVNVNVYITPQCPSDLGPWSQMYQALLVGGKNGTMLTVPWGVSQVRPCPGYCGGNLDLLGQE